MTANRKTSAQVAKIASKQLSSKTTSSAAKKVAASALSQRAPVPKQKKSH